MKRVPLVRLRVGPATRSPTRPGCCARLKDARPADLRVDQPLHRAALAAVRRGHGSTATWSRRPDGDVWQWDLLAGRHGAGRLHQPGGAPLVRRQAARRCSTWASTASRPTSASASRPTSSGTTAPTRQRMHNYYAYLYNKTRLRAAARTSAARARRCCSPARPRPAASSSRCTGAATATSTFESMAETLRGGLSLARQRVRLLEPRHRRLRGHAGPGGVQALAAVRPAVVAQPAARLATRTACRGRSTSEAVDVLRAVHPAEAAG